jgi:hypothetical protein
MLRPSYAAFSLTAAFAFVSSATAAEGTTLEIMNKAIAEAKASGKPMFVVGGAPER